MRVRATALGRIALTILLAAWGGNVAAQSASAVYSRVSGSVGMVIVTTFEGELVASGSAVTVAAQTMVTNRHVLLPGHRYFVLSSGARHEAFMTNCDSVQDLCLLSVPSLEARPVEFADPAKFGVGDTVFAIGAPKELSSIMGVAQATRQKSVSPPQLTISNGMITALRPVEDGKIIQTNAAISSGSSGGGLFDINGRLAGITTFGIRDSQNLNMALPVNWVERLGVSGSPRTEAVAEAPAAAARPGGTQAPLQIASTETVIIESAPPTAATPAEATPGSNKLAAVSRINHYWLAGIPVLFIVLILLRRRGRSHEDHAMAVPLPIPKPDPLLQACIAKATEEVDAGRADTAAWERLLIEHKGNETTTKQAYIQRRAAALLKQEKDRLWALATQQTQ